LYFDMQAKPSAKTLFLTGLASACLFGAATPASKALLESTQPQTLAGLLYLGAAIGVIPSAVRKRSFRHPWQLDRRTLRLLAGAVFAGGILGPVLLLLGLGAASSGSVALWLNLEFVATVLLGHFVFREHLTARGWIAAGGTLAASVFLAAGEGESGILSASLVACACICWGFDNHWTALIDGITPSQTAMVKGFVAGAFNLIMGAALSGGVGGPHIVALALLVGAIAYGVSVTLYITAAQGLGASRSQMIFSTAPFFGVLLSVVALGEPFTGIQALSAGFVMISLAVLFSEKHGHLHRHDCMAHQHAHGHADSHHDHPHDALRNPENHTHRHEHPKRKHTHKHWPDLHHRHGHGEDE
jgi:drug/metabolite transporter (DMT)-like permease